MTRRELTLLAIAVLLSAPAVYSLRRPEPAMQSILTLTSDPYRLDYVTMSLTRNLRSKAVSFRMRRRLHWISADEPGAPSKALFRRAVYVLQREDDATGIGRKCMAKPGVEHVGAGCGEWTAIKAPDGSTMLMPADGMTNHWTVTPGHH